MSTPRARAARLLVLAAGLAGAAVLPAQESPGLGVPVSAEEVAVADFVILPDGQGLPGGSGSARAGVAVYQRECRLCHGDGGEGGPNDRLVGGVGSLATQKPVKTVGSYWPYATTLFDYLRRAMPYHAPGSLSNDELYAVTAYLLSQNGVIGEDAIMDATSLPMVRMPNRDGFTWAWPEG